MYKRIDPAVKDRIIDKIKNDGMTVREASNEFGISTKAIYNWIGAKGRFEPGALEMSKLRRENEALKQIIGQLLLDSERGKKIVKIKRLTMDDDKGIRPPSKTVLARKLGVDKSYICRIEKGEVNPTLDSINKLAHVLGVEAWEMLK